MKNIAKYRNANSSAQKVRIVAKIVRGKKVFKAMENLTYINKKAANIIKKVIKSAVANAENDGAEIENLTVKKMLVDEGPSMKRITPRAKGRADRIKKRTSHITVILSDR